MATIVEALRHAVGKLSEGQFSEVERISHEVLQHEPQNADALHLLGLAARKQEQPEQAAEYFRRAIAVVSDKPVYYFELGIALRMSGDVEGALAAYEQALALDPQMHAALVNGGAALDDLGRNEEAIAWYRSALRLKPECVNTLTNLGNSLQTLEQFDESIASYRRALELDPAMNTAHWNFAMALLRSGQFREGWEQYDWRCAANETKLDVYPQPAWDGSSLAGKTLLVHAEQGIGDEILFASCYPDLIEQAGHCIFICEPRLASLFTRSFPEATVIGYRRKHERTPCEAGRPVDFQIPAGSLPRHLRPDFASFPQRDSYLTPDPARLQLWRERFAALGPGLKVGISWRAGGKPSEQVRRTTDLMLWRRLFKLPACHYVNLQYGQAGEEIARARQWGGIIHDWDDADALTDLDGLAAMISALDLVIAVGNTTVHLAGALGAPAWSLVAANPSWRWMHNVDRVPWYSSVRLFRQSRGEDWQSVLDRVEVDLCKLAGIAQPIAVVTQPEEELATASSDEFPETSSAGSAIRIPAQVSGMKFVAKLTEIVESAVKHHQAGELEKAEAIYREVLKNTPQHADALHLLGVVCQQTGRPREAVKLIKQAIVLCDTVPGFHFHLGLTLKDAGQVDEALACYRRALELKPDFVEVLLNLGAALQDQGRLDEAIECYQRALDCGSDAPGLHLNLGAALRAKGSWDDARTHLERAIELQPAFPEARVQIGLLFQERRQLQEAMESYQQALTEQPDHAAAYRCLGKALQEQQRWDEAILCYQRALEIKPRDFDSAANLGVAFEQQEQFSLAADSYRQALQLQPHGQTRLRLLTVLRHLGRLNDARQVCDELIGQEPDHALAHWTRAQILLQQGELQRGWQEYSWRWRLPGHIEPSCEGIPLWDGSSLAGKTILVHGDPALGDMLLLMSCLPPVLHQAHKTVITCERPLANLLKRTFPTVDVRQPCDAVQSDVQIPLARLPQLLQFEADQFRTHRVPLIAGQAQVPQSDGHGPRVGVLWRGRHKANVQPGTSRAPALEHWQPLLSVPEVQFISLLDDATDEELKTLCGSNGRLLTTGRTADLDAWAAQIASLDLIITVDDLLPHLAANLGKQVWLVLPYAWGWQWPLGQETSPWYDSVRLFRPKRQRAWPELMSRLSGQLAAWLSSPSAALDSQHRQPQAPHAAIPPSQIGRSRLTMQHGSRN